MTTKLEPLRAAADRLIDAQRTHGTCRPVRDLLPGAGVGTAYAVQDLVNKARDAAGGRRVGRKIGLTGAAIREQLGAAEPDHGVLFADMSREQDDLVDPAELTHPRIEAEVAVVLAADLDAPVEQLTPDRVRAAVDVAIPAFEIPASRVADWDITPLDTIADNASAGMYVLGAERVPLGAMDLRAIRMRMTDDDTGAEIATGRGTDCLGDPVASLTWLARAVAALGTPLQAGDVVLTGALGPMIPVQPGRGYAATLAGLGSVRVRFAGGVMKRVAIVTGAGSGIGRVVARALLDDGWAVALVGRRAAALAETADKHPESLVLPANVTDEEQVTTLFEAVRSRWGRLDLLFNNAGSFGPSGLPDEIGVAAWRETVDVNLTGAFLCARAAFAAMRTQEPPGGRIVNNGSISAHVPRPRSVAYTATKHAMTGLTKSLALDGRGYGIAVGQIDIGNAATEMTASIATGARQADGSLKPEPTFDAADVAGAILWMASLPPSTAVPFLTITATGMPFLGRG